MPDTPTDNPGSQKGSGLMGSLFALPNDSPLKTILVALLLCLVCSVLISTAAVSLKPLQIANKDLDRKKNILEVTKLMQEGGDIAQLFKQIEPKIVDLAAGEYVESIDPNQYDQRQAAKDPNQNLVIPPQRDLAQIKQRAKYATVYLVRQDNQIQYFVLPIHGYGLWSTLYGFLVLKGDANTVFGLQFYEHRETPGLGGEVDNPKWRKQWEGKLIYDKAGTPRIQLVKGAVEANDPSAQFHVDGLSGATLTANGVTNMLQYWLGEDGFGPYLQTFKNKV